MDSIEKTIYKLELDGSGYIEGANKVFSTTNSLSNAQETANAKLITLQEQNKSFKKALQDNIFLLRENEKETIALSQDLNALKEAGNGSTAAANKLKSELRALSTSTKELRLENSVLRSNISDTSNQIKVHAKEVKAAEAASGGFAKGATKAYSALRQIANVIPGIGIGGLVLLIAGPLVNAFKSWFDAANSVKNITKEIVDKAIKEYTKEEIHLDLIKDKLDDLTIPQAKRVALAKDYNKTAEEGNKIDLKQIDNIDLINAAIDRQIAKIKERALARAAENVITEKAEKLFLAQAEFEERHADLTTKTQDNILKNAQKNIDAIAKSQKLGPAGGVPIKELLAFSDLPEDDFNRIVKNNKRLQVLNDNTARNIAVTAAKMLKSINDYRQGLKAGGEGASGDLANIARLQDDLNQTLQTASGFITIDGLFTDTKPPKKGRKPIVNIYETELQKLKADIAKLDEKGFTDEATITKAIDEDFKKRSLAFDKAFKNKQLTADQLGSLKGYLKKLQDLTLSESLKSFREQKEIYLKQISDELSDLQFQESTKRISTIQDRFERERQLIIAETDKTENALKEKRDKIIINITKDAAKHGLTASDIAPQIDAIKTAYSNLIDDLQVIKNQKLQQLSFDTFEKLSEDAKRILDSGDLGISQGSLVNIKKQTELFTQGKIGYEKYQEELTAIARFETNERFSLEKLFLEQEIKIRQDKLANDRSLTNDQIKQLRDEITSLQQRLADAEKGNLITNAENKQTDRNKKLAELIEYADAIHSVIDSVVGFWQAANDAETKALDRSITLQEKRVDAAQRIAARGNAQYLKQEEDRLRELNLKRENAARKQLGIDAALQASQILVGITGAIAKIATPGIGAAETIGEIAIIIGALATGYGLVKSLQGNQPKLAKGDTYVKRGKNPSGTDTIPAWLNEGEAVTSAEKNKAYHPTVLAIHNGSVPAEQLNNFVKNYHKIKPVPQPNYSRIKEVAELHIGHDGRMAVELSKHNQLLKENNDLQRQTIRTLHKMGVNVSLDQKGFAVTQMEVIEQMARDKKL